MGNSVENELGTALLPFKVATIHERGLAASQWGKSIAIPWDKIASIHFHLSKETVTLVAIPVAAINTRKLTLTADDGTKIVLTGTETEQIYSFAVATTTERRLTKALDRLEAGETIEFPGLLSISREALTYTVLRFVGPFPKVPWTEVASVTVADGWVRLSRYTANSATPGHTKPSDPQNIAATWAVDNLDIFMTLAESLATDTDESIETMRQYDLVRTCPKCSKEIRCKVRFCRYCFCRFGPDENEAPVHESGLQTEQPPDTAEATTISPGTPPTQSPWRPPAAPAKKQCPRCQKGRTDSDLTCPHCGYTDWGAIVAVTVMLVAFGYGAFVWGPGIENPVLWFLARWVGGVLAVILAIFLPVALVSGIRGTLRRWPPEDPGDGSLIPPIAPADGHERATTSEHGASSERVIRNVPRSDEPAASSAAPIRFTCPNCGRALSVKPQLAGRQGKCPGCQQSLRVPGE